MDSLSRCDNGGHHYTGLALLIMWYWILVIAVDLLSAWLRRLVTGGGRTAPSGDHGWLRLHVVDHLDYLTVPERFEVGLGRRWVLEPAPSEIGAHIGQLSANRVF